MMRGFGTQLEQIQLLIDKIQHHLIKNASFNPYDYEKLLSLSTEIHYSYGKALAHVFLAQYSQATIELTTYHLHLDEARSVAGSKNFFDILIKCYQLEGNHNRQLCDEMTALSNYLEGLTLAIETKDTKARFLFYQNIAELFSDCGAYEDAQEFYQKALGILDESHITERKFYHKSILISLLRISSMQGNLKQSEKYWEDCIRVPCELGNLPLLMLVEELRILLLRGDETKAQYGAEKLIEALRNDNSDALLLLPVYLYGVELLIYLKHKEFATWCIEQIDERYPKIDRKNAIRLQKLRVWYAEVFEVACDSVYEDFYRVAQQGEIANQLSTAETFRSMIALYEKAKEQSRMAEERTDLQDAVDKDQLTQIYNRRYYSKLISKNLQDKSISSIGCIMIDVDLFKSYNDYYGHLEGDYILKEVALLLENCLPQGAYAARYGGDEFSCLFTNCTEDELITFVKRVRCKLGAKEIEHIKNKNGSIVTLSFGIYYETDLSDCNEDQIFSRADQALYQAKEKGRDTYSVYRQRGEV